jgi:hypothetical protein
LFAGFDNLYAITYSGGIDFMCRIIGKFKNVEIIFGFADIISYSLQEIIAYQIKTVERIKTSANKNEYLGCGQNHKRTAGKFMRRKNAGKYSNEFR